MSEIKLPPLPKQYVEPKQEPVVWRDPAYKLIASICRLPTVGDELIRLESVMELITSWRAERDRMPTPYPAPQPTPALVAAARAVVEWHETHSKEPYAPWSIPTPAQLGQALRKALPNA